MISKHMALPFEWGVSDCSFWAQIVNEITGWNPMPEAEGYADGLTARRLVRDSGFSSIVSGVEQRFHEIPVAHAIRGDLVYPKDELGPMASPFILDGSNAFSKSMAGPLVISREQCVRAFAY